MFNEWYNEAKTFVKSSGETDKALQTKFQTYTLDFVRRISGSAVFTDEQLETIVNIFEISHTKPKFVCVREALNDNNQILQAVASRVVASRQSE